MIQSICIKSLKSIVDLNVSCKSLNVFVGANSSGKSTFLQSLLLASQNVNTNLSYGLNGPMLSLGEFRDANSVKSGNDCINIDIVDDRFDYSLTLPENGDPIIRADAPAVEALGYNLHHFHYLSCNRVGAKDIYHKNLSKVQDFGIDGEYAIDYLSENGLEPLSEDLIKSKDSYTMMEQVNYWLNYIVGATIKYDRVPGTDILKVAYENQLNRELRPKNIGSGVSFLISILVTALGSHSHDIILIENPEIHLHPLAQSRLCEFLYFVSKANRQFFIETHSDHIFNGIRVGVATDTMDKNVVGVNFIHLDDNVVTQNSIVEFGPHGNVENPQALLFDQFDTDLDRMLGL